MFDSISRKIILSVADNPTVQSIVEKFGMASENGFARRFVAGETVDEAIAAAKELNASGITVSLDLLGESVTTIEETHAARDQIMNIYDKIAEAKIDANVSVKLTQLGLDLGEEIVYNNVRDIVLKAREHDNWLRIDMESSYYTEMTMDIFKKLFHNYPKNLGIVLQSYLYRTESDVRNMNAIGAGIRLCKGAYKEPEEVAFRKKKMSDDNFIKCLELMLLEGGYAAIATHDEEIIARAKELIKKHDIPNDKFEFQMLFGIRKYLQRQLLDEGFRLRIYVPFGVSWYPYFSRRLGERAGNVMFILKALLSERD